MVDAVKRDYRSDLRTAQARETRRGIVAAAASLFVETGYGATTIDAVARVAGVSRKTVFTAVGGKVELLKLALDWAIAGDDEPVAVADRPEVRALLDLPDAADLLTGWATVLVEIDKRVARLSEAMETAAGLDPAAKELVERSSHQRLAGSRLIVDRVSHLGALRDGVSPAEAADIAWLLGDPVLYTRLVLTRGWSVRRFEHWVAATLRHDLIG
ncbi:TetR family transcriptional regulator [soil metagenome]